MTFQTTEASVTSLHETGESSNSRTLRNIRDHKERHRNNKNVQYVSDPAFQACDEILQSCINTRWQPENVTTCLDVQLTNERMTCTATRCGKRRTMMQKRYDSYNMTRWNTFNKHKAKAKTNLQNMRQRHDLTAVAYIKTKTIISINKHVLHQRWASQSHTSKEKRDNKS